MANNRLYLVHRAAKVRVYVARLSGGGPGWDVIPGLEQRLQSAFNKHELECGFEDHGWELCDEGLEHDLPKDLEDM